MKHQSNIDITPQEHSHRKKWWAIGNNMLEAMRKKNEWQWAVPRMKKIIKVVNKNQTTLEL